jgi:aspartyl-tRNA(Asn)/glutamyl-tRNA(Gln) amidotransferase subunit B
VSLSEKLGYQATIGIEVHVQLATKTKIFCACPVAVTDEPNKHLCPVCAGHPGVLPVLNAGVIDAAIMLGLATHSTIGELTRFARKHYMYPDLPKGYQITQADKPICTNGMVTVKLEDGTMKQVRLMRIHIEEDAGKNMHSPHTNESFVDLNRAGTPLLEVVSMPDIESAAQARAYLKALWQIVTTLGISTGNMEEGAFRADINVSVRLVGQEKLGTRVELKNLNSFKFVFDAVEYEIDRQIQALHAGEVIRQETRLWDTKERKTYAMRSKEQAADYRYMLDPDLPPIVVTACDIERIAARMPELPLALFERLQKAYGLSSYEADVLMNEPELCAYYEQAMGCVPSKLMINWVLREVAGAAKEAKVAVHALRITPARLATLIQLIDTQVVSARAAADVFAVMLQSFDAPHTIVKALGLEQVGDSAELEALARAVIEKQPDNVAAYKAGKDRLFGAFVGQVMAQTQGRGNPKLIADILKKLLA